MLNNNKTSEHWQIIQVSLVAFYSKKAIEIVLLNCAKSLKLIVDSYIMFLYYYLWLLYVFIYTLIMGIQRKGPQINWLASFAAVVFAGCAYRVSKVNKSIM